MRIVVQRVAEASVELPQEGHISGRIGPGLLAMVGLQKGDARATLDGMVEKLLNLRIFADSQGKMNLSVVDIEGAGVLLVPNFTVGCEIGKGRRPSFDEAMPPAAAREMFDVFVEKFSGKIGNVQRGVFGAHMRVHLTNDGPVTFILESRGT